VKHGAGHLGVSFQVIAKAFRQRQYPLAHSDPRKYVVAQVGRGFRHAASGAGWANTPAFARKGDQKIMTTVVAAGAGEAMGQYAAFQVAPELPLDLGGDRWSAPFAFSSQQQIGFQVLLNQAV